MILKKWLTYDLRRGDLHALVDIAAANGRAPDLDQLERLNRRGFISYKLNKAKLTAKGRLALLIRRFV